MASPTTIPPPPPTLTMANSPLSVLQWNIHSLRTHNHDLQHYIAIHKPTVICLQETLVYKGKLPKLPGYICTHKRGDGGCRRGMLTAVRSEVPHKINPTPPLGISDHHIIDITIQLPDFNLRIINIYRSAFTSPEHLDIAPLANTTSNLLLLGDLNALHSSWGRQSYTNLSGIHLNDQLIDSGKFTILNDGSCTHSDYRGNSNAIDLSIATNAVASMADWATSNTLKSDHYAIEIHLNHQVDLTGTPTQPRWKTEEANWGLFRHRLDLLLHDYVPKDTAGEEASQLESTLDKALEQSLKKTSPSLRKTPRPPWLNDPIYKQAKNIQNQLLREHKKRPTTDSRGNLKAAQKITRELYSQARNKIWLDWCGTLGKDSSIGEMWKNLKRLNGKGVPTRKHPQPQTRANELAQNYAQRAESSQLPPEVRKLQEKLKTSRVANLSKFTKMKADSDKPFTSEELCRALAKRKKSAPGQDGITFEILSHTSPSFRGRLLHLYNLSWEEGKLPKQWKSAIIQPIPKPSDPENPRPISLLSTTDKIMEKMVLPRLQWQTGPLHKNIRGFVKKCSTADCLAAVNHMVTTHICYSTSTRPVAVFIDLEKAFELAAKLPIVSALIRKGVKGKMLAWLADYLTDRSAQVRFQGKLSTPVTFENGTPQGSILSPMLFNLLMEQIVAIKLSATSKILSYADDLALLSQKTNSRMLSFDLFAIEEKCNRLGLKVSAAKTKAMSFHSSTKNPYPAHIQGQVIEWVNSYKYLGITLDKKLTYNRHINGLRGRISARLNMLRYMSACAGGASMRVQRMFYLATIRSLMEYLNQIFFKSRNVTSLGKLDILQNTALRCMTRAPKWTPVAMLEQETHIQPLSLRRKQAVLRSTDKALRDANHPVHMRLLYAANNEAPDWNSNAWVNHCGEEWRKASLPIPPIDKPLAFPPWEAGNAIFIIDKPEGKKSDHSPVDLRNKYLASIHSFTTNSPILAYTDGSVDPDTKRASCGIHLKEGDKTCELSLRLKNGASSLQTELLAILITLQFLLPKTSDPSSQLVICCDSLGSLQVIQQNDPLDNLAIVSTIQYLLRKKTGPPTIFIWIPSHVGIPGNEKADELAKLGLLETEEEIPLPTISRSGTDNLIRHYLKEGLDEYQHLHSLDSPTYKTYRSRTKNEPQNWPGNLPRADEVRLLYVRMGYKLSIENPFQKPDEEPGMCPDCGETYSLVHHIIQCNSHLVALTQLLQKLQITLPPILHEGNIETVMTDIIQNSTVNPEHLVLFLKQHPPPR